MTAANENLRLAVPRGRILEELLPLMAEAGIEPEPAFFDKHERKLEFASNIPNLSICASDRSILPPSSLSASPR